MSSVAKRYASALMDEARESDALAPVGRDLHALAQLFDASDDLKNFVTHPLLSPEKQQAGLDGLFKSSAHPLIQNFFKLLIARERLDVLPEIVRVGLDLWQKATGIQPVRVLSAEKLTAAQEKDLTSRLSERTGKTIQLTTAVEPDLIGGFRLHIGDQVEDYSLAAKLNTFKRNVLNA